MTTKKKKLCTSHKMKLQCLSQALNIQYKAALKDTALKYCCLV